MLYDWLDKIRKQLEWNRRIGNKTFYIFFFDNLKNIDGIMLDLLW